MVVEFPSNPPGQHRVTVVNDSPEFLLMMGELLEADRYHASLIDGDNISSIEPIRATNPELLIVDLRLQGAEISGWEILQAIRADEELARLPIIICTADSFQLADRAEEMAQTPGVEVLLKPFHIDELDALVRRLIG
jgi:two-component system nitrogen regulation response regulator NtrX